METPVICLEPWSTFKSDFQAMSSRHWQDVALNKDRIKLNVNWDYYDALASGDLLQCVSARLNHKLIGYHVGFVLENPHYQGYKMGQTDVYYLLPEHREGMLGMQLFQEVERCYRAAGCIKMISITKLKRDISPLFEKLGWTMAEKTYTKELA